MAGETEVEGYPGHPLLPLPELVDLHERISLPARKAKVAAVALNTRLLDEDERPRGDRRRRGRDGPRRRRSGPLRRRAAARRRPRRARVIVAVIADTHLPRGSRELPDECVRRLAAADLILHAGDHSSVDSLEALRALGPPVEAVFGNADEPAFRALLPSGVVVEAGRRADRARARRRAAAGAGGSALRGASRAAPPSSTATRTCPQVEQHVGVWILNPGSPTDGGSAPVDDARAARSSGGGSNLRLIELP